MYFIVPHVLVYVYLRFKCISTSSFKCIMWINPKEQLRTTADLNGESKIY
jgi:hypothetical protein